MDGRAQFALFVYCKHILLYENFTASVIDGSVTSVDTNCGAVAPSCFIGIYLRAVLLMISTHIKFSTGKLSHQQQY